MVIRYAANCPVFNLGAIGTLATGIRESLNLIVDQAMAAPILQLRTIVTAVSFVALGEEITNSTPTSPESLLSWAVKAYLGPAPRQKDSTVGNLENKPASPQNWQLIVELFLVANEALMKDIM